jgi:tetratricopeptide (TPR) repeat protein
LALWRGPPLAEFALQRFAQAEIARLEGMRLACLEERIEADLAAGRHAELVAELQSVVKEHPLRERLQEHLLLALYRAGRQAEALAAYQDARGALVEELGIEPGKRLRELQQAILRQDPALDFAPVAPPPVEAARGIFVGRERELAELVAGLDDASAGRGRLFFLVGEPGIGKSRLADELIRHARERGFQILVGRCWEASGAPPYWPWVQSLRGYVREAQPDVLRRELGAGAAELAQILPELRTILPGLPKPASLEPDGARFRLFDATAGFLREASRGRPLVLFLDDLHAADAPSLLLLQFLARELDSTRMLVLGAFRDIDPTPAPPLVSMLAEVAREAGTTRLSLRGLSEGNIAEYVELTAAELASPDLIASLYDETDGNPLFVGETVRLLVVEGRIAIPQSIRDVISRRLAHLAEECNRVLVLASVLGREFALDALARLSEVSEDELLDTLDEAMAARVLSDVPGARGRLRFSHVLIRDTLYAELTTARRVRLHRLAVEALETLYGEESGPHLAELAHHAIAGSEFEKGVASARRAGDRALMLLAFEEATRLYATALEALELARPADERSRCELLLALGEAEARAGNRPSAKDAFLAAAEIAEKLGLARELARAAAGYGGNWMASRPGLDDRLVPLLEQGLAALGDDDVELQTRLLARLAGALRDEPSPDRRDRLSREAIALARRSGNPAALAAALDGRGPAILSPHTLAECLAVATELQEVAELIGDRDRVVRARFHRIIALVQLGDIRGAEVDLEAASRIAETLKDPNQVWQVLATRAMLALAAGRLAEAEELIAKSFALGERAQPEMAIPIDWFQRFTLLDFRGELGQMEPPVREMIDGYPTRPTFRCASAYAAARLGHTGEAERALDELGADDFSVLPVEMEWLFAVSLLAETSALLGETRHAPILYGLLLPWAALNVSDHPEGIRGSAARYLGLLATTLGRWEAAEEHYEEALAMNERLGLRPWLARTQEDFARLLRLRAGPGDAERAEALQSTELAAYRELGMVSYGAAPA